MEMHKALAERQRLFCGDRNIVAVSKQQSTGSEGSMPSTRLSSGFDPHDDHAARGGPAWASCPGRRATLPRSALLVISWLEPTPFFRALLLQKPPIYTPPRLPHTPRSWQKLLLVLGERSGHSRFLALIVLAVRCPRFYICHAAPPLSVFCLPHSPPWPRASRRVPQIAL